jgi:ubiquitin carboxyl-terminal hydrolase 14
MHSIKCDEDSAEAETTSMETFVKLRVNIGAGVSTYMTADLANGFIEKLEKISPNLNRSAVYSKTTKISRLPEYLAINFVRFQWKPVEKIKAKILKKVKFPMELDMAPLCIPELMQKLGPAKAYFKELDEAKAVAKVILYEFMHRKIRLIKVLKRKRAKRL